MKKPQRRGTRGSFGFRYGVKSLKKIVVKSMMGLVVRQPDNSSNTWMFRAQFHENS